MLREDYREPIRRRMYALEIEVQTLLIDIIISHPLTHYTNLTDIHSE